MSKKLCWMLLWTESKGVGFGRRLTTADVLAMLKWQTSALRAKASMRLSLSPIYARDARKALPARADLR